MKFYKNILFNSNELPENIIHRDAEDLLIKYSKEFPIIIIKGPRQSGKSTLAQMVFRDYSYVSFDDAQIRSFAKLNPTDFLKGFKNGLIIDEAQKIPEIFDAIKLIVDQNPYDTGKYVLTGSSSFKLKKEMSDSLAGRAGIIELLPLSINELNKKGILPENKYSLMYKGGYPALYDNLRNATQDIWFSNYIKTYIEKDISEIINPNNIELFKRFLTVCATFSGKLINKSSIARDLGITEPTITSWLSILESSYIIKLVYPDLCNIGKQMVKTPKLYFLDTGLLSYLLRLDNEDDLMFSDYKGTIVETLAISELSKARLNKGKSVDISFYRDIENREIDIIANWKHTQLIEVKSSEAPSSKFEKTLKKYANERKNATTKCNIFYLGELNIIINDINYIPIKDWGNEFN